MKRFLIGPDKGDSIKTQKVSYAASISFHRTLIPNRTFFTSLHFRIDICSCPFYDLLSVGVCRCTGAAVFPLLECKRTCSSVRNSRRHWWIYECCQNPRPGKLISPSQMRNIRWMLLRSKDNARKQRMKIALIITCLVHCHSRPIEWS
jgi:hypothetical protein